MLARDRVRFIGDRVAAIAADTRHAAEEAAQLVEVEYQELVPILSIEDALADGAAVLHPDAEDYVYLGGTRPAVTHANVQGHLVVQVGTDGERAAAFARAYRVFEHTFRTPRHHQGHIEPHACAVWIEPGGTVRVISTTEFKAMA